MGFAASGWTVPSVSHNESRASSSCCAASSRSPARSESWPRPACAAPTMRDMSAVSYASSTFSSSSLACASSFLSSWRSATAQSTSAAVRGSGGKAPSSARACRTHSIPSSGRPPRKPTALASSVAAASAVRRSCACVAVKYASSSAMTSGPNLAGRSQHAAGSQQRLGDERCVADPARGGDHGVELGIEAVKLAGVLSARSSAASCGARRHAWRCRDRSAARHPRAASPDRRRARIRQAIRARRPPCPHRTHLRGRARQASHGSARAASRGTRSRDPAARPTMVFERANHWLHHDPGCRDHASARASTRSTDAVSSAPVRRPRSRRARAVRTSPFPAAPERIAAGSQAPGARAPEIRGHAGRRRDDRDAALHRATARRRRDAAAGAHAAAPPPCRPHADFPSASPRAASRRNRQRNAANRAEAV